MKEGKKRMKAARRWADIKGKKLSAKVRARLDREVRAQVKREPVDFDYTALNWDFIKAMAWIPLYAVEKYGAWEQYCDARLRGDKSPINHAIEHIRQYMLGEPYDKRDGNIRWHLAAAAYNLSMEAFYHARWGHEKHPLTVDEKP